MDLIEKSLAIALRAYSGKKDKAGETYILHPLRVMAAVEGRVLKAAALLHDVIEDSELTAADLEREGIPGEVIEIVLLLTRQPGETYEDFVDRVAGSESAVQVKLADIEDNLNIARLAELSDKDLNRIVKYHRAWHKLSRASRPGK